jgi:hypothetical protein
MLRITQTVQTDRSVTLRVEGEMIGPWVAELVRVCAEKLAAGTTVVLEMADVSFLERKGALALVGLIERGVVAAHCSAFLTEQLKAAQGAPRRGQGETESSPSAAGAGCETVLPHLQRVAANGGDQG